MLPPRLVTAGETDHHPLTKSNKLHIATLNTRTLRTNESLLELEEALKELNWDILGISEMRRAGESIEEHTEYIMFNKGETGGQRGVGFMVKTHLRNNILNFIGINDRIAILLIKIPGFEKTWTIIQAYAPTEQAATSEHIIFYNNLSQVIYKYPKNIIVLMGDFNAQVGTKQNKDEYVLGNFGHGKRSTNGQRLIEFSLEHNLTLLNSIFKKNKKNKWTWTSPDGKYKNEIDYIMCNHPRLFTNTSVITKLNFNTNHRMIRASLKLIPPKNSRKHITTSSMVHYPEHSKVAARTLEILGKELLEDYKSDVKASYAKLQSHLTGTNTSKPPKHKIY